MSGFLGVRHILFVGRFARCLLICARQLGMSDRRWVVFGMFGTSYAQCNPKRLGGRASWLMLMSGFYEEFSPVRCLAIFAGR